MLDFAIRKSEDALGRVVSMLVLSAMGMLGLVWLSIAASGLLAQVVSPPAAAAITGSGILGVCVLTYLLSRTFRQAPKLQLPEAEASIRADDVTSRAMRIAEKMAPGTPMLALVFALFAGLGSVSLPAALNPFLNKILDDFEQLPDTRKAT